MKKLIVCLIALLSYSQDSVKVDSGKLSILLTQNVHLKGKVSLYEKAAKERQLATAKLDSFRIGLTEERLKVDSLIDTYIQMETLLINDLTHLSSVGKWGNRMSLSAILYPSFDFAGMKPELNLGINLGLVAIQWITDWTPVNVFSVSESVTNLVGL